MRKNDITLSNVKETWTMEWMTSLNGGSFCHFLQLGELLQNRTQFFSIAYIGVLC